MVLLLGKPSAPTVRPVGLTVQHDKNDDGYLTKDEVIQLSESLLVSCHPHYHVRRLTCSSSFETNLGISTLQLSPSSS
jgi:hypothetical protein